MAKQFASLNGWTIVEDDGDPGVPLVNLTGDGGDALGNNFALLASGRPPFVVDTVADLQALASPYLINGQTYQTLRYSSSHTVGDGSRNIYRYVDDSEATVDNGFILDGPGSVGRFIAVDQSVANAFQFGAVGDGSTDCTSALQAWAGCSALHKILPEGSCVTTDTLEFVTAGEIISGPGSIVVAEGWAAKAVVELQSDDSVFEDIDILETNASPTNADKNSAFNVGLGIYADRVTVRDVVVDGFGFPVILRGASADYANCHLVRVVGKNGYSWGIEVNSCTNCVLDSCDGSNNGLDGIKIQNAYTRNCDGLRIIGCIADDNGQRDSAAGGSETTNGNGFDLYQGGYRFSMVGCTASGNYGANFNIKGGGSDPVQGEGLIVGCSFNNAVSTSAGVSHGVEINTSGGSGGSWLQFIGCNMSSNSGNGIAVLGGFGFVFQGCNVFSNGTAGINLQSGFEQVVRDCKVVNNTGPGIKVGVSSTGAFASCRTLISGCTVLGNYDDSLGTYADPRTSATTKNTTNGIITYSDVADITIENTWVSNCASAGAIMLRSGDTRLRNVTVYNALSAGIQVAAGVSTLENIIVEATDFGTSTSFGSIYIGTGGVAHIRGAKLTQASTTSGSEGLHIHSGAGAGCTYARVTGSNFTNPILNNGGGLLVFDNGDYTGIPTSEPATAGQIWSNSGVLTISDGP